MRKNKDGYECWPDIECGKYKNIIDLYNKNSDFKLMFNQEKGNTACHEDEMLQNYFENHGDRTGIIEGVLADVIGDDNIYKWKISDHEEWQDQKIKIRLKKCK